MDTGYQGILLSPQTPNLVIASCLYWRGRYCSWTMNSVNVGVVGWIKQSGSTVANIVRRCFSPMVDPLRLIHPTFEGQFMERSEATKQSRFLMP